MNLEVQRNHYMVQRGLSEPDTTTAFEVRGSPVVEKAEVSVGCPDKLPRDRKYT